MEKLPMTYSEALQEINTCIGAAAKHKRLKEALQIASRAIKTELGRWRRFDTDLECAESDYVRDFAFEHQDLEGENADDFFGDVKADGFDMMEAFHDGAEWQHSRDASDDRWVDFDHIMELLRVILESHMHGGESDEVLAKLDDQVRAVWNSKENNPQ